MGRYMMLRQLPTEQIPPGVMRYVASGQTIKIGGEIKMAGTDYIVADAKDVTCVASEGELPFNAPPGLPATSIDLMAPGGECASIQKDQGGEVEAYVGRYLTLADLHATGLRPFEGWPMPDFGA